MVILLQERLCAVCSSLPKLVGKYQHIGQKSEIIHLLFNILFFSADPELDKPSDLLLHLWTQFEAEMSSLYGYLWGQKGALQHTLLSEAAS